MSMSISVTPGMDAQTLQVAISGVFAGGFLGMTVISHIQAKREIIQGRAEWLQRVESGIYRFGNRNEASSDLAERMTSGFWYPLLGRLTGIAPLLGVVATTLLFWLSPQLGSAQSTPGLQTETLVLLKPVFLGVFLGALLAIINQIFVIRIERFASTSLLDSVESVNPALLGASGAIFGPISGELDAFIMQLRASNKMLEALTKLVHEAGTQLADSARGHFAEVSKSTREFRKGVTALTNAVSNTTDSLNAYLSETTSSMNESRLTLSEVLAATQTATSNVAERLAEHGRLLDHQSTQLAEATRSGLDRVFAAHASSIRERVDSGYAALEEVQKKLVLAIQPVTTLGAVMDSLKDAIAQSATAQRGESEARAKLEAALTANSSASAEVAKRIETFARAIAASTQRSNENHAVLHRTLVDAIESLRSGTTARELGQPASVLPADPVTATQVHSQPRDRAS